MSFSFWFDLINASIIYLLIYVFVCLFVCYDYYGDNQYCVDHLIMHSATTMVIFPSPNKLLIAPQFIEESMSYVFYLITASSAFHCCHFHFLHLIEHSSHQLIVCWYFDGNKHMKIAFFFDVNIVSIAV